MYLYKGLKTVVASALLLSLSSCLMLPGKFTSDLTLLSDGSYEFSYDGEIQLLALASMMSEMNELTPGPFEPYCDEEKQGEDGYEWVERDCTKDEIADQRARYEAENKERAEKNAKIKASLGGIDPEDPATIDEFAKRLERQVGWQSVVHKGNSLFEVSYRTKGIMPDNFGFPLINDVPTGQPFLTLARWKEGQVKIEAPLFVSTQNADQGFLTAAFMSGFMNEAEEGGMKLPDTKGQFSIHTDGEILTNNTETGAVTRNGLKVLIWKVGTRDRPAPEALIGF